MGKRSKSRRNNQKNPGNSLGSKVESVSGRTLFTLTVGSAAIPVSPASFPRCLAMADVFNLYRFTRIKFHIIPDASAAVGYSNGEFDTPPSTVGQIMELPYAGLCSAKQTTPVSVQVPRSELIGDSTLKWYKTIVGTPAVGFEIQGNLFYLTSTTFFLVVEWTCEFTQWNLAANSPMSKVPSLRDVDNAEKNENSPDSLVIGGVTYKKSQA
jgi:hypothetical protein